MNGARYCRACYRELLPGELCSCNKGVVEIGAEPDLPVIIPSITIATENPPPFVKLEDEIIPRLKKEIK